MAVLTSSAHRSDMAPEDRVSRERTRLAYAVHDGLTQVVTASVLELEWLARRVEREPTEATDALERAAAELRKALDEIRDMLATLSPETPSGADRLDDVVRGVIERWQLPATWSVEGDVQQVPGRVLQAASAVIRESVANAAKHSGTHDVSVRVSASDDAIRVLVEDHGRGFLLDGSDASDGHLGLEMMRRLVAEQSGSLEIESSPGNGTRVVARLPVRIKE
jgi:signal transduction histidine kinase